MEMTSCEYSQPNSPQDWTRRREELGIIKSVQKIEILSVAFKHGFGSSNTDKLA